MFDVKKLIACLPEGVLSDAEHPKILNQLRRFDPGHQARGTTYLSWKLFDDRGRGSKRFPDDPDLQLLLISRTVRRERDRARSLREDHGWIGSGADPIALLDELFDELASGRGGVADYVLDSMVMVAMTADEEYLESAIELVEYVAESLPSAGSAEDSGPKGSLSEHGRSVVRYLTRELNDFQSRRRNACDEIDALLRGEFDSIASWAEITGGYKNGEYVDHLDFTIFPPGVDFDARWRGDGEGGQRRQPVVDAQRFLIFTELERILSRTPGVVCRRIPKVAADGSARRFGASLSEYQVMTVRGGPIRGEHAVAVSPMALEDAVYVVREDVAGVRWPEVLRHTKKEARNEFNARRLFVPRGDRYEYVSAAERIAALLTCTTRQFCDGQVVYDNYLEEYVVS